MSRKPYKHPSVFVGCPYYPNNNYKAFKKALDRIPIEFVFADTSLRTQHVLERIRSGMARTDYSIFDITGWNANVTLEVGLAEGLGKSYYILFRPGRGSKNEPPSDLKGMQRLQFGALEGFADTSLEFQLNHHLVRRLTHPRHVYDQLSGPNREKTFIVAMRILAHFKRHKLLRRQDLKAIIAGSYLRDDSTADLLGILHRRRLITGRLNGGSWRAGRALYKGVEF